MFENNVPTCVTLPQALLLSIYNLFGYVCRYQSKSKGINLILIKCQISKIAIFILLLYGRSKLVVPLADYKLVKLVKVPWVWAKRHWFPSLPIVRLDTKWVQHQEPRNFKGYMDIHIKGEQGKIPLLSYNADTRECLTMSGPTEWSR